MVTDASPRSLLVRLFRRTVLDDEARALLRRYSPLYQAHEDMPPVLLVNGTGERLWAQAQAFASGLPELGVAARARSRSRARRTGWRTGKDTRSGWYTNSESWTGSPKFNDSMIQGLVISD